MEGVVFRVKHRWDSRDAGGIGFCAKHGITADIELIGVQEVNTAFERLEKGDVKYRFVIDMKSI